MTPDPITEIPPAVIQAARVVSDYFAERGCTRWALNGVCSRNFESEASTLRMEVEALKKSIGHTMRQEYSVDPGEFTYQYGTTRNPKIDSRPQKEWYAPGDYLCHCRMCEQKYMGDKLSFVCADCAYSPKPTQEEQ